MTTIVNSAASLARISVLLIATVGCSPPPNDSAAHAERVRNVVHDIIAADNRCDIAAVIAQFTDDAMWLPPNEDPVKGKAAIRKRYEMLFKNYQPDMKVTCDEVVISADWAYVIGNVTGKLTSRTDDRVPTINDAFVMILRRSNNGDWHASRLMWHAKAKNEQGP